MTLPCPVHSFPETPSIAASRRCNVRSLLHRRHIFASKTGLAGKCVTCRRFAHAKPCPWLERPEATSKTFVPCSPKSKRCARTSSAEARRSEAGGALARSLCSLGRGDSHVELALDTLIATLRRLIGESSAPYPAPAMARAGVAELEAEADLLFGKRRKGARARVMATLPAEAAAAPDFVNNLLNSGMDCARINCAHDDAEMWGQMIRHVRAAAARLERPCPVMMDLAGPKCRILRVKAPPKTRLMRGDRLVLIDELREKVKEPIAFSLNFPELVDQLAVGADLFIDGGRAAARVVSRGSGRAEIEVYAAREKGVRLKP